MSDSMDGMAAIEPIFRKALGCSDCFICQGSRLQRALVDMAQPRAAILRKIDNMDVDDPRRLFYGAMVRLNRYEDYYSAFGDRKVYPESFPSSPRSAKTEMQWARKRGWIADG